MICETGVPRSSPVSRPYFSHTLNSSCTWLVLRRLNLASSSVMSMHALGELLRCRQRASPRAKKSPQRVQKDAGCASVVSQCCLKPSQSRKPAPGQSRHFSTRTAPRFQSACTAASLSRVRCHSFSVVHIRKRSFSPCSSGSSSSTLCSSTCCCTTLLYWCHVPPSTLSSTQVSSCGAVALINTCWTLGPDKY